MLQKVKCFEFINTSRRFMKLAGFSLPELLLFLLQTLKQLLGASQVLHDALRIGRR